jgi:hypothetical protein
LDLHAGEMGRRTAKGKEEGNNPAAGAEIHHTVSTAHPSKTGEEHRVQGEAISFSRLKDLEATLEQAVQGLVPCGGKTSKGDVFIGVQQM